MDFSVTSLIKFVEYVPENAPSDANTQTGDSLMLLIAILATILMCASIALKIYQYRKQSSTKEQTQNKTQVISRTTSLITWGIIAASGLLLAFALSNQALPANAATTDAGISASDIEIQVDKNTGELHYNNGVLTNTNAFNIQSFSIDTELDASAKGLDNVYWQIKYNDTLVYYDKAPGHREKAIVLPNSTQISCMAENIDAETAKDLIGTSPITLKFNLKKYVEPVKTDIDPQPKNAVYNQEKFKTNRKLNIVSDNTVDEITVKHLTNKLTKLGIQFQTSAEASKDLPNVFLATAQADIHIVQNESFYADPTLQNNDGHIITIDNNFISVLGKDTTAVFMGITSLNTILDNIQNNEIQGVQIKDYAQAQWRGFIEGYYGIPWTNENRMSLMDFGSQFKMNSYIFAPKDDPYHSTNWREPYPADKLASMKELADCAANDKVDFTWAIHPLLHKAFDFNNYDAELKVITDKFEQLYGIGVRHFGLSADDISGDHPVSVQNQLKLLEDLSNWCKTAHPDVKKLVFVPECYQWNRGGAAKFNAYWQVMKNASQDIDMMWTGDNVMGHSSQSTFDRFKQVSNHEAYMWWNFPVNDYCKHHLLMGKSEMLDPNSTNFIGLVSNPMQQAQASKIALFSVANYTWSTANFDAQKIWEKSFKYVDAGAPDALKTLSSHMCFSKAVQDMDFEESPNMIADIEKAQKQIDASDYPAVMETFDSLKVKYNEIADAVSNFENNHENAGLYEEIQPWLDSLKEKSSASVYAMQAIENTLKGDEAGAKECFKKAKEAKELSENHEVPVLPGASKVYAEPASRHLVPFLNFMINYLAQHYPEVSVSPTPISDTTDPRDI